MKQTLNEEQKDQLWNYMQVLGSSAVLTKFNILEADQVFAQVVRTTRGHVTAFTKEEVSHFLYISPLIIRVLHQKVPKELGKITLTGLQNKILNEELVFGDKNSMEDFYKNMMQEKVDPKNKMLIDAAHELVKLEDKMAKEDAEDDPIAELIKELTGKDPKVMEIHLKPGDTKEDIENKLKNSVHKIIDQVLEEKSKNGDGWSTYELSKMFDYEEKEPGDCCMFANVKLTNYLIDTRTKKPLCEPLDKSMPNQKYAKMMCIVGATKGNGEPPFATYRCGGTECEHDHIATTRIYFPDTKEEFFIDPDMLKVLSDEQI